MTKANHKTSPVKCHAAPADRVPAANASAGEGAVHTKKNIILIGMPGVGKTTIAKRLSRLTGMPFLDTDRIIEEKKGKPLSALLSEVGPGGFKKIENEVCASITAEGCVIATGGSVVYGKEAMAHLSEIGCIVYLKLRYPLLTARLKNLRERGVVLRRGQTLSDLYRERTPLYEKYAHITVDERTCYPAQTADRVCRALIAKGFFGDKPPVLPERQKGVPKN